MPRQQQVTPIERDFVRRLTSGWLAVSNGQAFNWEYGRRIWGVGSIYPGSYLDARTPLVPSAAIKPTLADLRKSRRTDTPAAFVF